MVKRPNRAIPVWHLRVKAFGARIDPEKQELLADVKAVSFHRFSVKPTPAGWTAEVVVDV